MKHTYLSAAACLLLGAFNLADAKDITYVQALSESKSVVKIITPKHSCPHIQVDGKSQATGLVVGPDKPLFPNRVCQLVLDHRAKSINYQGKALPVLPETPHRIVLIGDTGCSMGPTDGSQNCDSSISWPYQKIIKKAAALNPDLVIHLGDRSYVQPPIDCPNKAYCKRWSHDNSFRSMYQYYFKPSATLHDKVPWIEVRGNHDDCKAIGKTWFRYFSTQYPKKCLRAIPTLHFSYPGLDWYVIDDSGASWPLGNQKINIMTPILLEMNQKIRTRKKPAWIFSHVAFYGPWAQVQDPEKHLKKLTSAFYAAASENPSPAYVSHYFAGHIHSFQVMQTQKDHPTQTVLGNSGTPLIPFIGSNLTNRMTYFGKLKKGTNIYGFGFLLLERQPHTKNWKMTYYNADGKPMYKCNLPQDKRSYTCKPTKWYW
jgi:hypothetical protein